MKTCYIRAEIIGELPSGQKRVHILANNADGIEFYTDDESIIYEPVLISQVEDGRMIAGCPFLEKQLNIKRRGTE